MSTPTISTGCDRGSDASTRVPRLSGANNDPKTSLRRHRRCRRPGFVFLGSGRSSARLAVSAVLDRRSMARPDDRSAVSLGRCGQRTGQRAIRAFRSRVRAVRGRHSAAYVPDRFRTSCSTAADNVEGNDAAGGGFEIDAALNEVTEIVVFEMKAAWLREDSLLDASGEEFVRQLRRKYGVLPADGTVGERPKPAKPEPNRLK